MTQGYHGRRWDAPMTDELPKIDLTGATCSLCQESITEHDDALRLLSDFHTECLLRSTLGDVQHLKGNCACYGFRSTKEEPGSYREQSQRALDWLVENGRGRWAS